VGDGEEAGWDMRVEVKELDEYYRRQVERKVRKGVSDEVEGGDAVCVSESECCGADALGGAEKVPMFRGRVCISFDIFKCGSNWDVDNREVKQVIDTLVSGGVLGGDTIEEVGEIRKRGWRVGSREEERTEILIEEERGL